MTFVASSYLRAASLSPLVGARRARSPPAAREKVSAWLLLLQRRSTSIGDVTFFLDIFKQVEI
jgi:hypothetical protein